MVGSRWQQMRLLLILTGGVFGIINTEMGVVGIVPQIAAQFNITVPDAGWTVSIFALLVAISAPILPLVCTRFPRRRMMITAFSLIFCSNLIALWAPNFTILLCARALGGIMHPVYVALAFTLAVAALPPERSAQAISWVFLGVTAGMVLGVPGTSWLAVQFSYEVAMLSFAVVNGLVLIGTCLWVPAVDAPATQLKDQLQVLKRPVLRYAFFYMLFVNGAVFGFFSFMSDFLNQVSHVSFDYVALILLGYSLTNIIGNLVAGKIYLSHPQRYALLLPLSLIAFYALLFYLGGTSVMACGLILLLGILAGMVGVVGQQMISKAAPEAPEFANGLFLTAGNAGTMSGTALCGLFITLDNTQAALWGSFIYLALGLLCAARFAYLRHHQTRFDVKDVNDVSLSGAL